MDPRRIARLVPALGLALALAACVAPPGGGEAAGDPQPAIVSAPSGLPPIATAATPTAPPAAFADAVAQAGERLLQEAQGVVGKGPRELVIDPPIDANTGQQTAGTVAIGVQMAAMIKARAPTWNVRPLTRTSLSNGPLLLIGTLTPFNTGNRPDEVADAFRICLALIDLRSGRLIAKKLDRSTAETVNAEPTALFRDGPTWNRDKTVAAYARSCQGSSRGGSIDPGYLIRLPAAALLNEAHVAYGDGKLAEAYKLFHDARGVAEPDDLRVLNGLYLTSWKTGRKKEAADSFGQIVAVGLDTKRLPIKMSFSPGTAALVQSADLQAQYALWMREVAAQVGGRETCMKVIGHTSRTGPAAANEALSQRRAAAVRQSLERQDRKLGPRLTSDGVGSREALVGLGTDDLRDALDRRIEFRTVDCS